MVNAMTRPVSVAESMGVKNPYAATVIGLVAGNPAALYRASRVGARELSHYVDNLPEEITRTSRSGLIAGPSATDFSGSRQFSSLLDKKPRFEIDDSGAKIKLSGPLEGLGKQIRRAEESLDHSRVKALVDRLESSLENNQFLLKDILDHDELYKNYPNLRDVRVTLDSTRAPGSGSYNPTTNTITISGNPFIQKDLFLHEIQHAIQEVEGFARGGNPDLFKVDLKKRNNEIIRRIEEMRDTPGFAKTAEYQRLRDEQDAILDELFALEGKEGIDRYQRLSGELEARAVQRRMNMTPTQRATTDPYSEEALATAGTTDPSAFITRFGGGQVMSVDPAQVKRAISVPPEKTRAFVEYAPEVVDRIKLPKKVYRGTGKGGSTAGTASLGKGLYTTTSRREAERYGSNVSELGPESIPKNPLVFASRQQFKEWLIRTANELGFDRLSDLEKAIDGDIGNYIRAIGDYDGVAVKIDGGYNFVKFPSMQ